MIQQELVNILHITDKAISKWERGISLPDVCLLKSISSIFDISVAKLIKGERKIDEISATEIVITNKIIINNKIMIMKNRDDSLLVINITTFLLLERKAYDIF